MNDAVLALDQFGEQLRSYGTWRKELAAAIQNYQEWYPTQTEEECGIDELRLYELVEALNSDQLYIALVGEFSRGKTELINAIFFADYNRRLLPSTPGRTTMCPTELLWDPKLEPSIRLLPIETRKSATTIAEFKKNPVNWTNIPLNLDSAEQMADALMEIVKSKTVLRSEAAEYGLLTAATELNENATEVEIPAWRHAIVNYPHKLLKQGLVVLDTPGLNALGSEPELTFNMLTRAHCILFVLAADTGVTKTDMDIWKNHVCVATHSNADSRIAALNKIDTLWDDLHTESEVSGFINLQAEETRRLLEIPRDMVFPVSAHKGLVGKIKRDSALISRSGLPDLEKKLSVDIVAYKQRLIKQKIVAELGAVVESTHDLLQSRIDQLTSELNEIHTLRGKSGEVIRDMNEKMVRQKDLYAKEIQSFQITRQMLSEQIRILLHMLDMDRFDLLVGRARNVMKTSWTTVGLRSAMSMLFQGLSRNLEQVDARAQKICKLVDEIYLRFHEDHGLPRMRPVRFRVNNFTRQFRHLHAEAEAFRNSPGMVISEQHFVIKKFFINLVSRARGIFEESNNASRVWAKAVLTPIYTQIREHKIMIDRRLENLEKIRGNHANLAERIKDMESRIMDTKRKQAVVHSILRSLDEESANPTRH